MLCAFSKSYRSSFTSYIHKHIPISLSLPFSLKSPNPNSFFSQRQHHQQQQLKQNTTQLIVSCLQIPIFSFYCYIIYTLVWKTVSWFSRKKKCIPKWIQPNPITYRVFFFASTSTAKRVICHFWLQLFLSLSLHLCLLISVVVVFFWLNPGNSVDSKVRIQGNFFGFSLMELFRERERDSELCDCIYAYDTVWSK